MTSMQGSCDATKEIPASLANSANPPGDVPEGRCVMGALDGLLRLASPNHYFWLDSVHLHTIPEDATEAASTKCAPLPGAASSAMCLQKAYFGAMSWTSVCECKSLE